MNIIQRAKAPTPKLFQVLRNLGLVMAAVGGTLVASPVALPAVVVTIAGYLTVAGGVLSAVSQLAVEDRASESESDGEDSD
ncbi:MAG: hypothetical protein WCY25_10250 [Moheibacter sp.]